MNFIWWFWIIRTSHYKGNQASSVFLLLSVTARLLCITLSLMYYICKFVDRVFFYGWNKYACAGNMHYVNLQCMYAELALKLWGKTKTSHSIIALQVWVCHWVRLYVITCTFSYWFWLFQPWPLLWWLRSCYFHCLSLLRPLLWINLIQSSPFTHNPQLPVTQIPPSPVCPSILS